MRIMLSLAAGALITCVAFGMPAQAQSNPSADDLIKLLKPSGSIGSGTRGIRPAGTAPAVAAPVPVVAPAMPHAAAPAAAPVHSAPPPVTTASAAPAAAPSANLQIQFASDSAELTPQARAALDQLGRALSSADLASYRFRIEGHTDTVGSPEHNLALSARRADAVVEYLATQYHVARDRMQAVGMGEQDLAVQTPQGVPEPRNRRVQVVNLGT